MASRVTLPLRVIGAFGGPTKTAAATGIPISTVDSWRKNGRIPNWRWPAIHAAAKEMGVTLPADAPRARAA